MIIKRPGDKMEKSIKIPNSSQEVKNKVKDSIFLGNIKHVKTKNEAEEFIKKIKEEYYDATHNVSAYIISKKESNLEYYDDDGEPSKSSGPPILKTIKGEDLVNTVIVVTRYFGGTELGIGGLIRAYGGTAKRVIKKAQIKELKLFYFVKIIGNYKTLGTILGQVEAFKGNIKNTKYSENKTEVLFYISPTKYEKLKEKLIKKTGNKINFEILRELYL